MAAAPENDQPDKESGPFESYDPPRPPASRPAATSSQAPASPSAVAQTPDPPVDAAALDNTPAGWRMRDSPVSDVSTVHDKLGFRPYVDAVAAFLRNPDTKPPLTMSVEGEWGMGKSSFMRQLKAELDKPPLPWIVTPDDRLRTTPGFRTPSGFRAAPGSLYQKTRAFFGIRPRPTRLSFWFNAWRHDTQDAMWATFALSVTRQLREAEHFPRRLFGDFKLAFKRIDSFAGWLHTLGVVLLWLTVALGALGVELYAFKLTPPQRSKIATGVLAYLGKEPAPPRAEGPPSPNAAAKPETPKPTPAAQADSTAPSKASAVAAFIGNMSAAHYWFAALFFLGSYAFWIQKHVGKNLELKLEDYLNKPDYKSRTSFIESFHEDFKKVVKAYAGDRKVFVFVDDLDRCDVPKAAELMQAINLMIGDDEHLFFILGMDREKVAAGISLKYKDLMPFLKEVTEDGTASARHPSAFGYTYLEKFIQITFRVPRPSEAGIQEFLDSLARNPEAFQKDEQQRLVEGAIRTERRKLVEVRSRADSDEVQKQVKLVAPVLDWNPRRIKQFINDFRLQAYIASDLGLLDLVTDDRGPERAKITLEQLGKYVAITMAWPDLIMDLAGFPQLLTSIYETRTGSKPVYDKFGDKVTLSPRQASLVQRWAQEAQLMTLLFANHDGEDGAKYDLAGTDLRILLNIAPRVSRTASTIGDAPPPPPIASSSDNFNTYFQGEFNDGSTRTESTKGNSPPSPSPSGFNEVFNEMFRDPDSPSSRHTVSGAPSDSESGEGPTYS